MATTRKHFRLVLDWEDGEGGTFGWAGWASCEREATEAAREEMAMYSFDAPDDGAAADEERLYSYPVLDCIETDHDPEAGSDMLTALKAVESYVETHSEWLANDAHDDPAVEPEHAACFAALRALREAIAKAEGRDHG